MKKRTPGKAARFLAESAGVVAIVFAMALPVILGSAGMAVDLAQAYNVKNRLADALDKAALAGGSTDGTETQIKARVVSFFNANYPADKLGQVHDLTVLIGNDATVSVSAKALVGTTFMGALGIDTLDVYVESKVKRELAGVEAVLVLDVTGSMADALGNTTKIAALKKAANNFITVMFSRIADPAYIKIGIVPFSMTVNVGNYGLAKDPQGNAYGTAFVSKPATDEWFSPASGITYQAPGAVTTKWWGCVTEIDAASTTRTSPKDTDDSATPNWGMYRYPRGNCTAQTCAAGHCTNTNSHGTCTACNVAWTCTAYQNPDPNQYCPAVAVQPLTNSQTKLTNEINALNPDGGTYGSVGMVWGYHVITPSAPFTEGVALNDSTWSKTVIFMSDGDNNANGEYSAYGANSSLTDANIDTKFLTTCTNMKNAGITIYTIAFGTGINSSTKSMFQSCATDAGKYFASSTGADLDTAFNTIANQLSSLHIVE